MQRSLRATLVALTLTAALAAVLPSVAQGQATRTWVSASAGSDANPCSRTAPCQTFAGAISKTAEAGEINAIDSGGFGAVTITKAITLDGSGVHASVLNPSVSGVVVNAGADDDVILRDIAINGGSTGTPPTTCVQKNAGTHGVRILKAASVRIENVSIQQQGTAGVTFAPAAPVAPSDPVPALFLNRVDIQGSCGPGVLVQPTAPGTADVTLRDTTISDTVTGVDVRAGGASWLTGSTIFDNSFGLVRVDGGSITSYRDNQVHGNGTDGEPTAFAGEAPPTTTVTETQTVTTPAPPPTTVTTTQTVTAPPTTLPAPTTYCTVPKLTGLTLAAATTRLARANCTRGAVTRRASTRARRGRVLSQRRSPGSQTRTGAAVALTVGR